MSCFRFGPQGHMVEIPAPSTGMGFDLNRDVTISELVSGERSVYRTPLGFKSFDMSWAGGTNGLGEFMDIFEGAYGNGPFYMYDPRSEGQNLLPARWASCWQLGHVANGWGRPKVSTQAGGTSTPEGKEVLFTGRTNLPIAQADSPFSVLIPLEHGVKYNVTARGAATGGAQLIATPYVDEAPLTPIVVPLNGTASTVIDTGLFTQQMFVKLALYVPAGATLMLRHMELMQQPEVLRTNLATNPSFEAALSGVTAGGGATNTQSAEWSAVGFYSLKVSAAGATGPSTAAYPWGLAGAMVKMGMAPGKTYTVSATARLTAAQTGSLDALARCLAVGSVTPGGGTNYTFAPSPPAPNGAGVTRLSVTFTVPLDATNMFVRLMNGEGPAGSGGSVWWDAILIEESASLGAYFDGSTPAANGKAYRWTGTANSSTSQEYVGDGKQWHMGRGVGAVQFNGNMQGTLTSNKVDRIGLSVGVTEVAS